MSISPGQIADLKYSVFYVPSVVYAYLLYQPVPDSFILLGASLPHPPIYPWAAILTLIFAVYMHNIGIAIFGIGGPPEHPKISNVAAFHAIGLSTPVDLDEWKIDNFDSNIDLIFYLTNRLTGFVLIRAIILLFLLVPGYLLFYYSIFPLTYYLLNGSGNFTGGLLWLFLASFFLHNHIGNNIPPTGKDESAGRIDKPEYVHYRELVEDSYEGKNAKGDSQNSEE